MDCLIDTNIVLRSADRLHPASPRARGAMKTLFTQGYRLCVAKQTSIESWVVATRSRDANGFGYSAQFAAEGISKIKRLFYLLAEMTIFIPHGRNWFCPTRRSERTLTTRGSSPRHSIGRILTLDAGDFRRHTGIQLLRPDEVLAHP